MSHKTQPQDIRLTDELERRLLQQAMENRQPFNFTVAIRNLAGRISRAANRYLHARASASASSRIRPSTHA